MNITHEDFELNHHPEWQHKLTHDLNKICEASLLNLDEFFGKVLSRPTCLIFPSRSLL